ncbi:cyclase dehydrase [Methylobacterium segetis]|uniref:cyclase dehydrase n=1 Tax=Methylobacterium segetis TaxID=2488750 RepID=UPI0010506CEC|nr:cyclase dehydrase [Methylobacterium segetis]
MRYEGAKSRRRGHPDQATDRLARGLGWFSIGLGLFEIAAARSLTRNLGLDGREDLVRAYGVREIGTGVGILTSEDPAPWIWGRVAGDALDLATLATGLHGRNRHRDNLLLAMAAVAGVTALDVICAETLRQETREPLRPLADYRGRSGFPKGIRASHGAARDLDVPRAFRQPDALRPFAA